MPRKKRRKSRLKSCPQGHYCWACDCYRPNERFSGRNHARHLCRECAKLGAEELAYRQALRDLERRATWEGILPRKRRKSFQRFLAHEDPRIVRRAQEMLDDDRLERAFRAGEPDLDDQEAWEVPF